MPPDLNRSTGSVLLVVQGARLEVLDVDTSRTEVLATDARLDDYEELDVLTVGDEVVLRGRTTSGAGNVATDVLATTGGTGSALHVIGQASRLFRSTTAGRVWLSLASDPEDPSVTFTEVDATGRVHQRIVLEGTYSAHPFARGFLRMNEVGNGLELIDRHSRVVRSFPGVGLLQVGRDVAVLASGVCSDDCQLHVVQARPPFTERRLDVSQAVAFGLAEAGLTPDGRHLFTAQQHGNDGRALSLSMTDLQSAETTVLDGALGHGYQGFHPQFTSDGRWMFWVDADAAHINVHDLLNHSTYRVLGDFRDITALVVLPR